MVVVVIKGSLCIFSIQKLRSSYEMSHYHISIVLIFQALDSPFSFNSGNEECGGPLMGNLHLKGLFNVLLLLLSVKDVEV